MPASSLKSLKNKDLLALQQALGYKFKDPSHLICALTHKSYFHEHPDTSAPHNERLEFLGDSVLGLVVTDHLYRDEGTRPESFMSRVKSYVVRASVLYEVAQGLKLGKYLLLGKGEKVSGGRGKLSVLSDALEAVIGAVHMDGGYGASKRLVLRLFKEKIKDASDSGEFFDSKSDLQVLSQSLFGELPRYRQVKEEGKEHKKVFTAEVLVSGKKYGKGMGGSKKSAEEAAARRALIKLQAK